MSKLIQRVFFGAAIAAFVAFIGMQAEAAQLASQQFGITADLPDGMTIVKQGLVSGNYEATVTDSNNVADIFVTAYPRQSSTQSAIDWVKEHEVPAFIKTQGTPNSIVAETTSRVQLKTGSATLVQYTVNFGGSMRNIALIVATSDNGATWYEAFLNNVGKLADQTAAIQAIAKGLAIERITAAN